MPGIAALGAVAFALALSQSMSQSAAAQTNESSPAPGFVNLAPEELIFQPAPGLPGASYAVLFGDPSEPGTYVMRYRIPAGQLVPPHFHDQDRHITVIAGPWAFGTGTSQGCEATVPMPAGSYVFHPSGAAHFDGSCTDAPIEVQVIGEGPVGTFAADTQ